MLCRQVPQLSSRTSSTTSSPAPSEVGRQPRLQTGDDIERVEDVDPGTLQPLRRKPVVLRPGGVEVLHLVETERAADGDQAVERRAVRRRASDSRRRSSSPCCGSRRSAAAWRRLRATPRRTRRRIWSGLVMARLQRHSGISAVVLAVSHHGRHYSVGAFRRAPAFLMDHDVGSSGTRSTPTVEPTRSASATTSPPPPPPAPRPPG